jgi:hypothetical protein
LHFVYKHTTPNSKVYIGITSCTPEVRWQGGYGYKNNGRFFKDILKYGWDNIKHEILAEGLTKEEALQMETEQIILHNSMLPQYGYNQSCTEMSVHNRAVNQYSTDGTLICTFPSVKSAAQSVSTIPGTITKACYDNHISRGYLWKFAEDKTELIIPTDLSRRLHSPHRKRTDIIGRQVAQYSKDGSLICIYNSAKEAHEKTGVNHGDICSCCKGQKGSNGRLKHTAGGYIWKYAEQEKEVG